MDAGRFLVSKLISIGKKSNRYLLVLGLKKAYLTKFYPEIDMAFKRLCDVSGYRSLTEAVSY